jgi:hypothetical protein
MAVQGPCGPRLSRELPFIDKNRVGFEVKFNGASKSASGLQAFVTRINSSHVIDEVVESALAYKSS